MEGAVQVRESRTVMADLAATGLSPDQIALVMELAATVAAEARPVADKAAENKRAYDREYQRERREDRKNRATSYDSPDGSLDKGFPATPSKTQTSNAPLTPQTKGKKRGVPIPADWTPPLIDELSPKAKEAAGKWPAGRYEAEAEAFVAFWLNDGRCRPDWRLTWISRIIAVHGQVMRDARFAPATNGVGRAPQRPMNAAELRSAIAWAEDQNDLDRAAELKQQLAALRSKPPDPAVAGLVSQVTRSLKVQPTTGGPH